MESLMLVASADTSRHLYRFTGVHPHSLFQVDTNEAFIQIIGDTFSDIVLLFYWTFQIKFNFERRQRNGVPVILSFNVGWFPWSKPFDALLIAFSVIADVSQLEASGLGSDVNLAWNKGVHRPSQVKKFWTLHN